MKIELITYGLGTVLDISKFVPIQNTNFIKPKGGLWSSPINSSYGWKEWCIDNDFGNIETYFTFKFEGDIYTINSLKDFEKLPFLSNNMLPSLDFEKILSNGIDAIFLTEQGQQRTRFTKPSLYGWDCECVLILNSNGIYL